jgi:hypothetical protein
MRYDPIGEFLGCCRLAAAMAGALAVMVALLACSDAKPVSYYKSRPDEREAKVQSCVTSGSQTQDCNNARQAEFEILGIEAKDGRALAK